MENSRLCCLGDAPDLGADSRPEAPGRSCRASGHVFSLLDKRSNLKVLKGLSSLRAGPASASALQGGSSGGGLTQSLSAALSGTPASQASI